jgi:hypothetical protein
MIEIPVNLLLTNYLRDTLSKLASCPELGTKITYRIMRTINQVDSKAKLADAKVRALRAKYIQTDAAGNFVLNEAKTDYLYKDGVDKESTDSVLAAYFQTTFSIEQAMFELEDFAPAKLTAIDMAVLEPFYNPPE